MQPLVMQEWPYVLPRCPEWHVTGRAQHSSTARPLSQVRAGSGSLFRGSFLQWLQTPVEQTGTSVPGGRKSCYLQPRHRLALNESVSSPRAFWLQSVSQSRAREATCRAGFRASFEIKSKRPPLTALVYLLEFTFFQHNWKNVSFC